MSSPKKFVSLSLTALAVLAAGSGAAHAGVINHDAVVPFKEDVTAYQFKFRPRLKVTDGCVPFPGVNAVGDTSGGLQTSGARNGHCSSSIGQLYVRAKVFNGECAVMYAWYFPKDQVISGHRHDWENIVLWLSECSVNARVNAISYSGHGAYNKTTNVPMNGSNPLVEYGTNGILDHQLFWTNQSGGFQPAIRWLGLTGAARNALNTTDFGKANVPFKDANYDANLSKAWYR